MQVLVATDVAARGLDVRTLRAVVNYDMPGSLDMYIHRVGRTGRQGAPGQSFTFFTRNFAGMAPSLVQLLPVKLYNAVTLTLTMAPSLVRLLPVKLYNAVTLTLIMAPSLVQLPAWGVSIKGKREQAQ